jgi:hypothetical protein
MPVGANFQVMRYTTGQEQEGAGADRKVHVTAGHGGIALRGIQGFVLLRAPIGEDVCSRRCHELRKVY